MASFPEPLAALISQLTKLPGIGPRSAERIALHLLQANPAGTRELADVLLRARAAIKNCEVCGGLTEVSPCFVCSDARRDSSIICVVERAVDIFTIEKSGGFRGKYHVLGGKISPINGVEPEDLRIAELEKRVKTEAVREIVIALPTDVEGDATSFYLARRLQPKKILISRIAHGIPAGSSLEFSDDLTLSRALEGRRAMDQER